MASSSVAQINVRLDRELKTAGDAALAEVGLSPSEAVRALWHRAAKRGEDLEAVADLLASRDDPLSRATDLDELLARGPRIIADGMRELGLNRLPLVDASDAELLETALVERYEERELA